MNEGTKSTLGCVERVGEARNSKMCKNENENARTENLNGTTMKAMLKEAKCRAICGYEIITSQLTATIYHNGR